MNQRWKVTVNRDTCLGSGICAATSPHHFRLDNGKSQALQDDIEPDDIILDAAETCPAEAITVYNTAGRRIAPDTT